MWQEKKDRLQHDYEGNRAAVVYSICYSGLSWAYRQRQILEFAWCWRSRVLHVTLHIDQSANICICRLLPPYAFSRQSRTQGLFPGQGKDPGNEVVLKPVGLLFAATSCWRDPTRLKQLSTVVILDRFSSDPIMSSAVILPRGNQPCFIVMFPFWLKTCHALHCSLYSLQKNSLLPSRVLEWY